MSGGHAEGEGCVRSRRTLSVIGADCLSALHFSCLLFAGAAVRFDAFLKENDQQAHDAVKKAEVQTKLKLDKAAELKKIRHAVLLVTAERSKLKETLDDYGASARRRCL